MVESLDEMMDVEVTGQAGEVTERSVELPLSHDPLYNLIVCNHCCVALPWEWVRSHLKEQHVIETTDEQVSDFLGLQDSALTVQQAVLANERAQIRSDSVPGLSVDTLGAFRVEIALTRS